jgi:hypothetical protein
MPRAAARLAVALLVVVASATVCGAASSRTSDFAAASSRTSQTTSTPPASKKYISKRYGYSIVLRGKYIWQYRAKQQWDGRFPFGDTGMVDVIAGVYIDHKFGIAAEPVSPGMALSEWEAFVESVQQVECSAMRNFRATSLGGEQAQEFVNDCPGPAPGTTWRVITLAALHNGRGYLLNYLSGPSTNAAAERRTYDAGRRSFRFTQ